MNVLKIIRLGIWTLVFAFCMTIIGLHLAASRTTADEQRVRIIAEQANIYRIVRDNAQTTPARRGTQRRLRITG